MKNKYFIPALLLPLCVFLFFECGKSGSGYGSSGTGGNGGGSTNNNSVTITDYKFSGSAISITAGTTVTWKNNGYYTHTVTSDNGSFDSGDIPPGSTFSYKFAAAGTYPYHCKIHTMMTASVTVN